MSFAFLSCVVVMVTLLAGVNSYKTFQTRIPNGDKVPNPCNVSGTWMGVGHRNLMGGGPLNPFGNDFKANGLVWNSTICQKDSDGDGLTNGQELGDPNCTWLVGMTPAQSMNLMHPGVCEPLGSTKCAVMNSWLTNCTGTKFECPAINDSNVKSFIMRFPPTIVPTTETTYMCHRFVYPSDMTADIIAIEPVIDNTEIIHHILLFGCEDEPVGVPVDRAYPCGMGGGVACSSLIGLWGVGVTGQCLNSQMGFRIGSGGLRYAIMQIHWNNHDHKANLTDSSGMKIYYTTQLRPNRGEILMVGQTDLEIPPGKDDVTFYGKCSELSTSELSHPVYITSSLLHMHLLGKSGSVTLYRNGEAIYVLSDVKAYDYNAPLLTEFETPIEVKPGDYIEVKCVYNSKAKSTITRYGEGTSDEMCFAFFAYYPRIQGFNYCGQWKSIELGANNSMNHDECHLMEFLRLSRTLPDACSTTCSNNTCMANLKGALMTGCQRYEDIRSFLQTFMPSYGSMLAYCSLALSTGAIDSLSSISPPLVQSLSCASVLLLAFTVLGRRLL